MFFLKKIFFLKLLRKKGGFNLIELLTTVAIVGTLTVVGIKSYQSQTNKARSAEAKHSLSYIYTAEQNFHDTWGTYHENLIAIGAVPSGSYHYDIGFSKDADRTDSVFVGGDYPLPNSLDIVECTNFYKICETGTSGCTNKSAAKVSSAYSSYFSSASTNCRVIGNLYFYNEQGMDSDTKTKVDDAEADGTEFKAMAAGQLAGNDLWSIDDKQTVIHEVDGTQ